MFVGRSWATALVAALPFNLQLFTENPDDELGAPLEIDVDALGDDAPRLKAMLGKALHENKRVRTQAGRYRTQLRTAEGERDAARTQVTALEAEKTDLGTKLETANRANGQYNANFKAQLVDRAVKEALKTAGAIDVDLVATALPKDKITCADETFALAGVDEAITAFKAEKAHLFGKPAAQPPGGTNRGGPGPGGAGTGGGTSTVDFRDGSKTLEQLERESNIAMFGRANIGGGM
jgi:hypothetical protein